MRTTNIVAAVIVLLASQTASAQLSSSSRSSTTNSQNGLNAASILGFGAAGQTFGTPLSASAFGGAGSGNMLRAAIGQNGMNGFGGMNSMGMMGLGGMGFGGMNRFGMGGFGGGMNNMQNQNAMNRTNAKPNLRIPMRVKFSVPTTTIAVRASKFETRLTKLPGLASSKNIVVTLDGSTVVLSGTVRSSDEKAIVEQLARLEPGVDQVRNELTVDSQSEPPAAEALPSPAKASP